MNPTQTIIIKDRNNTAYLLANDFNCHFVSSSDGGLDAEFALTPELEKACKDYIDNNGVAVQSFVAACKYIGDRIRLHRLYSGRNNPNGE